MPQWRAMWTHQQHLPQKRRLKHPELQPKNMNWSSKRNERIGACASVCACQSRGGSCWWNHDCRPLHGMPLQGSDHQLLCLRLSPFACCRRRPLTKEEQLKVTQDKEYEKFSGGAVRKTLVRAHQKPLDQVQAEMENKTRAFAEDKVRNPTGRHPCLADISSDIDWKHAFERILHLKSHYPVPAIVGAIHSEAALERKFHEICSGEKYMTIPLLAQAIAAQAVAATAKANGEKEGKNVDDSDEVTKLSNTMAFLNGKPDATAQVDVKNFIRACKRHEAIKHIVLHWRRRKKHRLAAQSMQLCKRWINFPLVRFTYIHVCMPHAGSTGPRILL